ncbi:MAG: hypothetical protein ACREA0_03975 [bacterium]
MMPNRSSLAARSALSALLVLSAAPPPAAAPQPVEVVETKLDRTRFCYGDAEVFVVQLEVRLKVRNTSDKTLILPRELFVPASRVSLDRAAAQRGEYDFEFGGMEIGLPTPPIPRRPDPKHFVLLAPGKTTTLEAQGALAARYQGTKPLPEIVEAGNTPAVRLLLRFWPALEDPDRLQSACEDFGVIVRERIWTEPLEISIPAKPAVRGCGS